MYGLCREAAVEDPLDVHVILTCSRDSYRVVLLVSRAMLEPSRYEPCPPSIQSSGTISATSSPSSNILTVELSETATATASVRLDTEAAATWRLPSPRGTSKWFEAGELVAEIVPE